MNILDWMMIHAFLTGVVMWILIGIIVNVYLLTRRDDESLGLELLYVFPAAMTILIIAIIVAWPIVWWWQVQYRPTTSTK